MQKLDIYKFIEIHGFKYDGTFYRRYSRALVVYSDDDLTVLYLYNANVSNRYKQNYVLAEPALWFFPHNQFWNAIVYMREAGYFTYINLSSSPYYVDNALKYVDFDLDIKSYPQRKWHIDDQKEFIKNKEKYHYPKVLQKRLFSVFEQMLEWKEKNFLIFDENFINSFLCDLLDNYLLIFPKPAMRSFASDFLNRKKNVLKERFKYPDSCTFKLYTCGPTVYSSPHIGNMRPILTSHYLIKAKNELGIKTYFVHNITDIDDKIIQAANEEGIKAFEIARIYKKEYLNLLKDYRIDTIDVLPSVTDNINNIKEFVVALQNDEKLGRDKEGFYFNLELFPNYGKRVNRTPKDENAPFYVWKTTKSGKRWSCLQTLGRPGWHTECAALVSTYFGPSGLDLHMGGIDLNFPHNENEDIQYYAFYGRGITKNWLHTGQINYENNKMSKSLGNIILARNFHVDVFKTLILNSNVTTPINLTPHLLKQQEDLLKRYKRLYFVMQVNSLKAIKDDYYYEGIANLSKGQFTKFANYMNMAIKKFHSSQSAEVLSRIKAWFEFIDYDFISELEKTKKENLTTYSRWQMHLRKEDYFNADKYRDMLLTKGLI